MLQSLQHDNIVQYLDSSIDGDELIIVFEWAAAGDLKRQVRKANERGKPFEERVIWKYFSQICDAITHMHSRRILHRDLKPANVFLTLDGTVKVGDLGLGRMMSEHTFEAHSKVGTPLYMSPEVLRGDGYDWKSDVWSLGCVLYELAVLKSPFKAEGLDLYSLFQKISKGDYAPPPEHYSSTLRELCVSMLSVDAKDRPDVAHVTAVANKMRRETMSAAAAARADAKRQAEEATYPGHYREESREATLADGWPGQAERPRSGEAERPSTRGGRSRPDRPASGDGFADARPGTSGGRRPDAARPPSAGARRPAADEDGWADARPGTSSGRRRMSPPDDRPPSSPGGRRPAATPPATHDFIEEEERPQTSGGRRPSSAGRARAAAVDDDEEVAKAASEGNRRRRRLQEETPFHEILGASESIVERLYVLGYAFKRRENHEPPLLRTHFALSGAGINLPSITQWADCMNACLFLIGVLGGNDREIAEAAPSQQATDLLNRIHAVGFNGQARPPDLAKGHGASATSVLDFLSRKAMDTITIQKPDYSQVDKVNEESDGNESDGIQEDCGSYVEEDVLEEDYVVAEDSKFCEVDENEDRAILQARTSVNEWKVELERVGPRLASKTVVKDSWRRRVLLTKVNVSKRQDMDKVYAYTKVVADDARNACDELRRGEGVLDQRHSEKKDQLMQLRKSLAEIEQQRDDLERSVAQKTDRLGVVVEEAREAQDAVEAKGNDLGDSRRLALMRAALKSLREESEGMEMMLGVALSQHAACMLRRPTPSSHEKEAGDDSSAISESFS